MRILFVSNPLYGHLNPILALARAARRQGHLVVVASGADAAPLVMRDALTFWPVGITHHQAGGNTQASWLDYFEACARARLPELLQLGASWRPDLVIHEETELSGPVVAASAGVCSIVHGLGPRPPERFFDWIASAIERVAPASLAAKAVDTWRRTTLLQVCPPGLDAGDSRWPPVQPLRATTPGAIEEPSLARRIERLPHEHSVFVTLGTVYSGNTAALAAALEGLTDLAVNLIVAAGPDADAALLEGYGSHVLIEPMVPLASVLARCRAVASQGGSGVMLGALAHGLPQLMLPQGADQFRNAGICTRTGAALSIAPADATRQTVAAAARRLLEEPRFAKHAGALRDEIAAMPSADRVVAAFT